MAYVNAEKKAKIAAALKAAIPAGWKYSLAVRHGSTIVLTVYSAPIDLIAACEGCEGQKYIDVNPYHWEKHFRADVAEMLRPIMAALNIDNFDKSDLMTDYFHVGHYVDFNIGRWDRAFEVK